MLTVVSVIMAVLKDSQALYLHYRLDISEIVSLSGRSVLAQKVGTKETQQIHFITLTL